MMAVQVKLQHEATDLLHTLDFVLVQTFYRPVKCESLRSYLAVVALTINSKTLRPFSDSGLDGFIFHTSDIPVGHVTSGPLDH